MKILVACEYSGTVRDAFESRGHDAWSVDLLPSELPGNHYQGDVFEFIELNPGWDLMIAHPPCTDLSASGARWWKEKREIGSQQKSVNFFLNLARVKIERKCIENPIGIMSKLYRKPDQYIEPYEYGHPETKRTCLWLTGLPKLKSTNIVHPENITGKDGKIYSKIHYMSGNKKERPRIRSLTYQGWADAMADQWG